MMYEWLLKLLKFGIIDQELYDWSMGRYYGYPDCCIKNYINFQKLGIPAYDWTAKYFGSDSYYDDIGFIRCPICRQYKDRFKLKKENDGFFIIDERKTNEANKSRIQ